jgi:hypothetical protein
MSFRILIVFRFVFREPLSRVCIAHLVLREKFRDFFLGVNDYRVKARGHALFKFGTA